MTCGELMKFLRRYSPDTPVVSRLVMDHSPKEYTLARAKEIVVLATPDETMLADFIECPDTEQQFHGVTVVQVY